MKTLFFSHLRQRTEELKSGGLYKKERIITSPQNAHITVEGKEVLNYGKGLFKKKLNRS